MLMSFKTISNDMFCWLTSHEVYDCTLQALVYSS